MKLVLHNYWRSSASHRVRIALGLKRLPYDYVVVNADRTEAVADVAAILDAESRRPKHNPDLSEQLGQLGRDVLVLLDQIKMKVGG